MAAWLNPSFTMFPTNSFSALGPIKSAFSSRCMVAVSNLAYPKGISISLNFKGGVTATRDRVWHYLFV